MWNFSISNHNCCRNIHSIWSFYYMAALSQHSRLPLSASHKLYWKFSQSTSLFYCPGKGNISRHICLVFLIKVVWRMNSTSGFVKLSCSKNNKHGIEGSNSPVYSSISHRSHSFIITELQFSECSKLIQHSTFTKSTVTLVDHAFLTDPTLTNVESMRKAWSLPPSSFPINTKKWSYLNASQSSYKLAIWITRIEHYWKLKQIIKFEYNFFYVYFYTLVLYDAVL